MNGATRERLMQVSVTGRPFQCTGTLTLEEVAPGRLLLTLGVEWSPGYLLLTDRSAARFLGEALVAWGGPAGPSPEPSPGGTLP